VSGPRSPHLELRTESPEGAGFLAKLAEAQGFRLGISERRGHALAYAKGGDAIAELLAFMGAQEAALELEEASVVAATRGRANRLANADHANLSRASRAADAQLRAIERLESRGRLDALAPELREVARLRRRHPTEPLVRLAARCRPPATKTVVHRRLAKLRRLAET
jgi:DNA-binding protein WhiA